MKRNLALNFNGLFVLSQSMEIDPKVKDNRSKRRNRRGEEGDYDI